MSAARTACIDKARAEIQDCLIVGAGINGAVSAAALSGRGARVTVIDKGDFASCTSQESSNLAWGGIKYLESYEFSLVWHLCASRNRLMDAYPSHVREIRFFTSIARGFRKPRIVLYLGALLYWFMGRCRTRPPRLLLHKTICREAPMVNTAHLSGGFEYSDCYFCENDAGFTFSFIRRVLQNGSSAINYMELISAERRDGIWHCALRDHVSGQAVGIRARTLVNAAGPYADRINSMLGVDPPFRHIFSKGVHIIVPRISETEHVLTFFASDGRLFFMIPMGERTCIGTTDTPVDTIVNQPADDDVDFLISNANALLDLAAPLSRNDVIATRCGVRPLVVRRDADVGHVEWTALSRKHEIDVQADRKMLTIYGGKLTDCLNVGDEVAEIVHAFGIHLEETDQWYGEEPSMDRTDATEKIIGDLTRGALMRMAREAMVVHLEDLVRRRTRLELIMGREALANDPGLAQAARILFGDDADAELEAYLNRPRPADPRPR